MSDRQQLMDGLRALGVSAPEIPSEQLDDEAVAGVLRWGRDQNRRGRPADAGLIASKLMNGGLSGYGTVASDAAQRWWQTFKGRQAWLERNVGDLNPLHAETAIIGLTQQNREPSVDLVREWTELVERQEREYDAACRALVAAQRKAALLSAKENREHSLPLGSPSD